MSELMYQCTFERGTERTVGWVPEKAAQVGKRVELTEMGGHGLWLVTNVGHSMTKKELSEKQAADRKQREASDI